MCRTAGRGLRAAKLTGAAAGPGGIDELAISRVNDGVWSGADARDRSGERSGTLAPGEADGTSEAPRRKLRVESGSAGLEDGPKPSARAESSPPRTPWGDPDVAGI